MSRVEAFINVTVASALMISLMLYAAFAFGSGQLLFTQWADIAREVCAMLLFVGWVGAVCFGVYVSGIDKSNLREGEE